MIKKQKFACFIAGFIFGIGALMNASAAAAETPAITAASAEGISGETVAVSISLSENPGIVSMTLNVEYDDSVLELIDVIDTGLMPGQMHTTKYVEPYILTWENDTSGDNIYVEGVIVNLVFKVVEKAKAGEYPIRITCPKDGILNYDVENIDFEFRAGTVKITENSPASSEEKHVHTMIQIKHKEATCYREGNVEYWMCTSCNKNYKDSAASSVLENIKLPVEPENHDGGFDIQNAVKAVANRDGYTGDIYCLGCETILEKGYVLSAMSEDNISASESTPENNSTEIKYANPFTDVAQNDWYYKDVEFVYENDLMIGTNTAGTQFSPDTIVNRAMLVTILWRLEGSPVVDSPVEFVDVPADEWYTAAVNWASANGIVNGYGEGVFGPLNDLTREQIMAILNRYAAYKGWTDDVIFPMIPQYTYSTWAENNVIWADMNGMFDGIDVDVSDLTKAATRAEMAAYLRRFCENIAE